MSAFERLTENAGDDAEELKSLSPEQALQRFVRHQLRPLLFQDELSRYVRMFAWESAHPTKVFRKFIATNTTSYLSAAVDLVRRSAAKHPRAGSSLRGHMLDGAMQRFRAKPRSVYTRSIPDNDRRAVCR